MKNIKFVAVCTVVVILAEITAIICKNKAIKSIEKTSSEAYRYTVVIDAGHGGIDGGVVGVTGVIESELNLSVSEKVKEEFERVGVKVVMTRNTDNGLYGAFSKGFKKRDMRARKEIIEKAMPSAVISIHMNSCKQDRSRRGMQTYYNGENESGRYLAESIASALNKGLELPRKCNVLTGDFYMLNCTKYPTVLIECGFISNEEDEKRLGEEEYQKGIAREIVNGVITFWQN